ncbi:hypothetical protein ENBRE01_1976 [Enteropsectra breve]|nr:hypothetical protein ENBRE01_1976 [Enteropsectra breve]
MSKYYLIQALTVIAHATISSQSSINLQSEPSIFVFSNSTVHELSEHTILEPDNRILARDEKQFSLEDDNFTEEEKMAKIQAQIQTMEKYCEHCKKPIITNFFPASITLACIMDTSDYPYKTEIVNFYDFHIKQCLSEKRCAYHRRCFSRRYLSRVKTCFFDANDSKKCFACMLIMPEEYILETAMQCLYKSTKPYEFAYIYKALKDYDGGDIRICLSQTDAPVLYAQKIKAKIEKCQFKGKNSMLASLNFFLLNENSEDKAAVLRRFLRYSFSDSILIGKTFWSSFLNKCKDNNEIRRCLMSAVDAVSEEHALMKPIVYTFLLYTCLWYFDKTQILQLITKCIRSNKNYLLSSLKEISSIHYKHLFESDYRLNKLPSALKILNILENSIRSTTDNTLLYSYIDKKARAVSAIISVLPFTNIAVEQAPIFIYLKRLYKMKSGRKNRFHNKKYHILFCDSLLNQLQQVLLESKNASRIKSLANNIMLLKICLFYSKKYGYKVRRSSFVARIFSQLDNDFKKVSRRAKEIEKCLTVEERREILAFRIENCNSSFLLKNPMELLDKKTQKSLAEGFVNQGRSLMLEGLQIVPQICKQFCTIKQYKRFLHDLCNSPEILQCEIETMVMSDLMKECKNIPRSKAGFLPLDSVFYDLLDCENWQDNEVMMWCEKNNFVKWLRQLPNVRFCNNKMVLRNYNKFIKRHFKVILKYVLEKQRHNICVEAELVVNCWLNAVDSWEFYNESNLDIFNALAAAKNGYFHANIFYLMKRKSIKQEIANSALDKICSKHQNEPVAEKEVSVVQNKYVKLMKEWLTDNLISKCFYYFADIYKVLELQNKYIKFVKKWEETDIMLSCASLDMSIKIRSFVEKLEEIKTTEVHTLFDDVVKHATALNSIREGYADFYRAMAESLDFIPQSAIDYYYPCK